MIRQTGWHDRRRRGFSLAEVVVSTLLVGVVLAGALNLLGATVRGRSNTALGDRARLLAEELLSEVLEYDYADPNELPVFGSEASEAGGNRDVFDDVDDFHNWDVTPPEYRDGTAMPNLTNWRRRVLVEYVDPNDPTTGSASDQDVKRITVEVYFNGTLQATVVGLRTQAWEDAQ